MSSVSFWNIAGLFSLTMGLMLSPDSFVILGNSAGALGVWFVCMIGIGVLLHIFSVFIYTEAFSRFHSSKSDIGLIKLSLGSIPATVLPVCSRIVFSVSAATLFLVTAGYVFNEVFVYWFPNLFFSFLILMILTAMNLISLKLSDISQFLFVCCALGGLILMIVLGLLKMGGSHKELVSNPVLAEGGLRYRYWMLGIALFMGYELLGYVYTDQRLNDAHKVHMLSAIVIAAFLFGLWGILSYVYVTPLRLFESTVPYSTVARAILGETGRMIIGLTIISGCLAAVNLLIRSSSVVLSVMAEQGLLPSFLNMYTYRIPLMVIFLLIAAMMAFGMGGEPETEIYARVGLYFWLLSHSAVAFSLFIANKRQPHKVNTKVPSFIKIVPSIGFLGAFLGLILTDPDQGDLLIYIVIGAGVMTAFSFIWGLHMDQKAVYSKHR